MNQPLDVVLLGGGGHASDVLELIEAINACQGNRLRVLGVADDSWARRDRFENRSVTLIDGIGQALGLPAAMVAAIGYPQARRAVAERIRLTGAGTAPALVHPLNAISRHARCGDGTVVFGLCNLSAGVVIGQHVLVSYGALIGHNSRIGDFTSIMPGACVSGDVVIGSGVLIGTRATVLEGLAIGDGAVVGAGAVVVRDVPPGETVLGVPAVAAAGRPRAG